MAASCASREQTLRHGQRGEITVGTSAERPAVGLLSEIRPDTGQCQADQRLNPGGCIPFRIRIPVPTRLVPTEVPSFCASTGAVGTSCISAIDARRIHLAGPRVNAEKKDSLIGFQFWVLVSEKRSGDGSIPRPRRSTLREKRSMLLVLLDYQANRARQGRGSGSGQGRLSATKFVTGCRDRWPNAWRPSKLSGAHLGDLRRRRGDAEPRFVYVWSRREVPWGARPTRARGASAVSLLIERGHDSQEQPSELHPVVR